jgi:hypothetical protein
MSDSSQRFGAVIAAIDAANARDPNHVEIDGPADRPSTKHLSSQMKLKRAGWRIVCSTAMPASLDSTKSETPP